MSKPIFTLRIMQCTFIVSVLLFIYVLQVTHPPMQSFDPTFQWSIVFCAIASTMMGFIMQRVIMNAPVRPNASGQTATPEGRWFTGHILRFATAESVALFGFVLRMMGSTSVIVTLLFTGSLLLLLLWQPGECPPQNES